MEFFLKLIVGWVLALLLTLAAWTGFNFFGWWGLLFVVLAVYLSAVAVSQEY